MMRTKRGTYTCAAFMQASMQAVTVLTVLLGPVTGAQRAEACTLPGHVEHVLVAGDPALDATPPTAAHLLRMEVKRGVGPQALPDGSFQSTSCDDLAWVSLVLVPASDDRTPPAEIGYAIEVIRGNPPPGLHLPAFAWRLRQNTLHLGWIDGDQDEQEPIDFTVRITPIDLAGKHGSPLSVRVQDAGRHAAVPVPITR